MFTTHQMPPARPVVDYVHCYSSGSIEHQMPRACPVDGYDRTWGRRRLRARCVRHHRTSRWHLWDIGTVYSSERNYPLDMPGAFPDSWTVIERESYFVSVARSIRSARYPASQSANESHQLSLNRSCYRLLRACQYSSIAVAFGEACAVEILAVRDRVFAAGFEDLADLAHG